jgi:hypothetical protein
MFKIDPSLAHAREISYYERRDLSNRQDTRGPNVSRFCVLDGVLDVAALRRALRQLAARHEALRTHFEKDAMGAFVRRVESDAEIEFLHADLSEFSADDEAIRRQALAFAATGFAADAYPLVRVAAFGVAGGETVVVISVAELIADGQAVSILVKELSETYVAEVSSSTIELPPLEFGLSAFVASQVEWMQSAAYRERVQRLQEKLHRHVLEAGGIEHLYFSPLTRESFLLDREFPDNLAGAVAAVARLAKVTVPTVLMALTAVCIARAREARGLFFTSTFSNRSINGTANLVGYLSTTMPSFLRADATLSPLQCVRALHRDLFLSMSQFGMIPIAEVSAGFVANFPPPPAGTSIKFGKVVMDVTQDDFPLLFGLDSRPFPAGMPMGLGAEYKFIYQAARSGAIRLWLRGLDQPENKALALHIVDRMFRPVLESMCE